MAGNQTQSFGYRLHEPSNQFCGPRSIDLAGVPTIPRAVDAWLKWEGSEGLASMPAALERQLDDAIEAACYVLHQRHKAYLAKLDSPRRAD